MSLHRVFCVALWGVLTLPAFHSLAQSEWKLDKCKNDIEVYTRYEPDSDFKSFKAVATICAPVEEIISVLRDADKYTDWYGFTRASKLLEVRENVQFNYVETTFPWPYNNRDMVYKVSIDTSHGDTTKVELSGLPDYIAKKKGLIRMKKAQGYMLLIPHYQETKITYVFHSEPGANIHPWLANRNISELPIKTLSGLKSRLQKSICK